VHTETRGMRMRTEGLENEAQHAKGFIQTLKNKIGELEEANINLKSYSRKLESAVTSEGKANAIQAMNQVNLKLKEELQELLEQNQKYHQILSENEKYKYSLQQQMHNLQTALVLLLHN
jgi:hypothetical protein